MVRHRLTSGIRQQSCGRTSLRCSTTLRCRATTWCQSPPTSLPASRWGLSWRHGTPSSERTGQHRPWSRCLSWPDPSGRWKSPSSQPAEKATWTALGRRAWAAIRSPTWLTFPISLRPTPASRSGSCTTNTTSLTGVQHRSSERRGSRRIRVACTPRCTPVASGRCASTRVSAMPKRRTNALSSC